MVFNLILTNTPHRILRNPVLFKLTYREGVFQVRQVHRGVARNTRYLSDSIQFLR